jgi:hypothetical protein
LVRGKNFYQPTLSLDVATGWQDWMIDMGVVNENPNGTFTFKRDSNAPTSRAPAARIRRSSRLQASAAAGPSRAQTVSQPFTAGLIEESTVSRRTPRSWRRWFSPAKNTRSPMPPFAPSGPAPVS